MDNRSPSGIFARSNTRHHRGHTSANVLSKNNRHRRRVIDTARHTQRLQNTDRCRGGLNHCRHQCTHQQAEKRIRKHCKQSRKLWNLTQRLHRRRHGIHSGHQDRKSN